MYMKLAYAAKVQEHPIHPNSRASVVGKEGRNGKVSRSTYKRVLHC